MLGLSQLVLLNEIFLSYVGDSSEGYLPLIFKKLGLFCPPEIIKYHQATKTHRDENRTRQTNPDTKKARFQKKYAGGDKPEG